MVLGLKGTSHNDPIPLLTCLRAGLKQRPVELAQAPGRGRCSAAPRMIRCPGGHTTDTSSPAHNSSRYSGLPEESSSASERHVSHTCTRSGFTSGFPEIVFIRKTCARVQHEHHIATMSHRRARQLRGTYNSWVSFACCIRLGFVLFWSLLTAFFPVQWSDIEQN